MSQPVQLSAENVDKIRNLRKPSQDIQERIAEATERQAAAMETIASDLEIIRKRFQFWDSIGDQD
jgi:hypothetical protein